MSFDVADAPELYAHASERLAKALASLSADQAAAAVPACPGWTVKDVLAHVSGLVAETLAGVPLPRGSEAATARQVTDRAAMSLSEVLDEWRANADAFAEFGTSDPAYVAALTADLVVHTGDIAEALDVEIDLGPEVVAKVAARYGEMLVARCAEQADTALTLEFADSGISLGSASGSELLTLTVTAALFVRSVSGRRTRSQVAALEFAGDPTRVLDVAWSQYGPLVD